MVTEEIKSIADQRRILLLTNKKAEEFYYEAKVMAEKTLESKISLSKTQVSNMLNCINTTSSSSEFLNYLKRQIGKARSQLKSRNSREYNTLAYTPPAWVAPVPVSPGAKEEEAFGDQFLERLEKIRDEAICDADKYSLGMDDKIKLCVLYLRQYLSAFDAHYLYLSGELSK